MAMSIDSSPSGSTPGSLLADSAALGSADPATALLALMIRSRAAESGAARESVNHANDLIDEARRRVQEEMKRAADAEEHAGLWDSLGAVFQGDIAAIAEVVATAALVAATGGTGTVAILALVATGLSVGADVGEKLGLDPKICAGLAIAGAAAGLAAGNLEAPAGVWASVARGAHVVQGAATAAGGGAHLAAGELHADALDARAEETRARGAEGAAVLSFNQALGSLARAVKELEQAGVTASSIARENNDGRATLLARMGAA
jgi:hypothetical protein